MFPSPRSVLRRSATCALALALVTGPAVVGGAATTADAGAAALPKATATVTATVTISARRSANAAMNATVVATVPGAAIAPIRVSMTASATRTVTSAASSAGKRTMSARAVTKAKAKAKARTLARNAARATARSKAITRASAAATAKARAAANAAARQEAIRLASAKAVSQALAAAPGSVPSTGVVSVTPASVPCGGEQPLRTGGGRYATCTFDDNFDGGTLDPTKWSAMDATKVNFKIGDECFNPNNVSVADGTLSLTGSRAAVAKTCAGRSTNYNSGLVTTKGLFSQTYGRFEMRAKFPKGYGYGSGFWMLPENPMATGAYKYGEIDVVENWGQYSNLMWAHVHYVYTPGNLQSGKACSVKADGESYHTYAVDWSASQMTFIYDGVPCWTTTWRPAYPYAPVGAKAPAPFDQNFYMIMNLSLGGTTSTAANPLVSTAMGKSMQVDWVRVWK